MNLGIVGSGLIVQSFLPGLNKLTGINITAIQGTVRSANKTVELCTEYNIPNAFTEFEQLYETNIDTIYIAVPNHLHFEYCKKALEHGYNVIVEKPAASNYRELETLVDLAHEKQLFLFEAITTIHLEGFKKLQELLPEIGHIKLVQSQYSQYSRRYDAFVNGEILPVFDPSKSGGAMMDLNLYNLHLVMGLFGKPLKYQYHANIEQGIDTSGILAMQYDGFQAICTAAKDSKGAVGAIIQGTKGVIKTTGSPNCIGEITLELNDGTKEIYDNYRIGNRHIPEFECFIDIINSKDYAKCDKLLEKSLAVSEVQTNARIEAGIIFPADEIN